MKVKVLLEYVLDATDLSQACGALYNVVNPNQNAYMRVSGFESGRIVKAEAIDPPPEKP